MRNSIKSIALIILAIAVSGLIYSCKKDSTVDANSMTDEQLIDAIQGSTHKQAVIENDLPESSQAIIQDEYTESFTNEALLAPELGYEVELRKGKGSTVGDLHYAYFDLNGRLLQSDRNTGKGHRGKEGDKKGRKDCFEFQLPITLTMPDATTITIESKEDWQNVKAWYEANPESEERPELNFPVNIVYSDGTTLTVINDEELKAVHEECHEGFHERCFDFVYPITFIMPDESEIIVSDRGDHDAIKAWYEGNPEAEERPELKFPVDIIMPQSDTLTLNTPEELEAIKDICRKEYAHKRNKCFEFVLPVTVTLPDSSTITIEVRDDWETVKEWYDANPGTEERPSLVFPVDITFADGTTVTINTQEELDAIKEECKEERKKERRNRHGRGGRGGN